MVDRIDRIGVGKPQLTGYDTLPLMLNNWDAPWRPTDLAEER